MLRGLYIGPITFHMEAPVHLQHSKVLGSKSYKIYSGSDASWMTSLWGELPKGAPDETGRGLKQIREA